MIYDIISQGYDLSWVRVVLGTICPGYELSWVRDVLGTSRPGYELSWVRVVLGTSCLGYELSWVRVVLGTSCLGYELCRSPREMMEIAHLLWHMKFHEINRSTAAMSCNILRSFRTKLQSVICPLTDDLTLVGVKKAAQILIPKVGPWCKLDGHLSDWSLLTACICILMSHYNRFDACMRILVLWVYGIHYLCAILSGLTIICNNSAAKPLQNQQLLMIVWPNIKGIDGAQNQCAGNPWVN